MHVGLTHLPLTHFSVLVGQKHNSGPAGDSSVFAPPHPLSILLYSALSASAALYRWLHRTLLPFSYQLHSTNERCRQERGGKKSRGINPLLPPCQAAVQQQLSFPKARAWTDGSSSCSCTSQGVLITAHLLPFQPGCDNGSLRLPALRCCTILAGPLDVACTFENWSSFTFSSCNSSWECLPFSPWFKSNS